MVWRNACKTELVYSSIYIFVVCIYYCVKIYINLHAYTSTKFFRGYSRCIVKSFLLHLFWLLRDHHCFKLFKINFSVIVFICFCKHCCELSAKSQLANYGEASCALNSSVHRVPKFTMASLKEKFLMRKILNQPDLSSSLLILPSLLWSKTFKSISTISFFMTNTE